MVVLGVIMESGINAWLLIDFATYHVNYTTGAGRPRVNARLDVDVLLGRHSREPTEKGAFNHTAFIVQRNQLRVLL